MHISKIHVSYHDGSKPKGTRVSMGFTSILGGMTKPACTDDFGNNYIVGREYTFVNGEWRQHTNMSVDSLIKKITGNR